MSGISSIDMREFRDGGDRGRNDYAYADPIEELGRGRRADRHHHGRDRGFPKHDYREPIFVQPRSQRFLSTGPIVTTPSMDLQVPSRPQPRYPPGVNPHYPPHNAYPIGYNPTYARRPGCCPGQDDTTLVILAIFVICFCPAGWLCGLFALCCVCQARETDAMGNYEQSQRNRDYSLYLSLAGGCFGIIDAVLGVLVLILWGIYVANWFTFSNTIANTAIADAALDASG
ncbi:uncharacterized protein [Apostichopus japonicus]|uniref:uncharacterized protein n=1 Tax=Stichopus japonicus TaxID=307972 RepID=UPI003AB22BD0